jgi:L-2-hydroxycarboxylate dehydrogenase (NAD+)
VKVPLDTLKQTTFTVLARQGYPPEEAQMILEVLMYAQLRGNNQGIVKLIGAGMPRDPAAGAITVRKETSLSVLLDGGRNQGMVVMTHAMHLALAKARAQGFGLVGTHNTNTSTGAIGYYAARIAAAGFIGLVCAGSGEYVAMYGAYEPIFGTNPLAIGLPSTDSAPVVFDMATAAIARFGIVEAHTAGRPIPPDVAYDAQGNPTTDPAAALGGAIRAFGGYKGAALALIVEVLTRLLAATTPDADGKKTDWGNLIMVLDPALLVDRHEFAAHVATLMRQVKATRRLPGVEEILIPGERGNRIWDDCHRTGLVDIEAALWTALQQQVAP